jgi:hypothetical protein
MKTKNLFLMMIAAATMVFAGCKEDDEIVPTLDVDKTTIDAAATAGTYAIAVTSNVMWTATVNSEAITWCTLANASGNSNGMVTVNVAENVTIEPRTATVAIAAGSLSHAVAVSQEAMPLPIPPYAASTQTWTFGNSSLIWSDVIHIPNCNNPFDDSSLDEPKCCSYAVDETTWYYYYNWPYVNTNKDELCPSPWRVPTKGDFETLVSVVPYSVLWELWPAAGRAAADEIKDQGLFFAYWSSTRDSSDPNYGYQAWHLLCAFNERYQLGSSGVYTGFEVRCVK